MQKSGIKNPKLNRWEDNIPHHPAADWLIRKMDQIDWEFFNGYADIKYGGDGDIGEFYMELLSIIFEDQETLKKFKKKLNLKNE